jgi:predicted phosphodiesterase
MRKTLAVVLTVFDFAFYLSMKSNWSGIEGMFGVAWLQYMLLGLFAILAGTAILLFFWKPRSKALVGLSIAGGVLSLVLFFMLYMGIGGLQYILRSFADILFWLVVIGFAVFMIFDYPHSFCAQSRLFKFGLLSVMLAMILIVTFNLKFCFITNMPVVYAVEEEYQIVWTTSANATGQVTIDGQVYSDLYAGSLDSETLVHKVVVPMAVLDEAKAYTITSSQIIYRGPYSGVYGRTMTKCLEFFPVDLFDGLNYYSLSDTHEYAKAASAAGAYFGEDLDFLILAGDISSHLEELADLELILQIAYNITKGSHPVIYARGNHETKGDYANVLYKYVGSKDEKFYFTVKMNGIEAIVLDLGEDHGDDWWEYYDTAYFTEYRNEQTAFLQDLADNVEANLDLDTNFRLVISHMPITYVIPEKTSLPYGGDNMFLADLKAVWTELLDTMFLDVMVAGHHHQLMPLTTDIPANTTLYFHENYRPGRGTIPVGYRTDSTVATFIVSRRSDVQNPGVAEKVFGQAFTGLATTINYWTYDSKRIILRYTNSKGEIVPIVNPFTGVASERIVLETILWPALPTI